MNAAFILAVHRLQKHSRAALAFGLLLATAGGMVAAVAAGAHRASSAFSRLEAAERVPDGYLFPPATGDMEARLEHLPEVTAAAYATVLSPTSADFTPAILKDRRFGTAINRLKYVSGRPPVGSDEAAADFGLARSRHLHVGSTMILQPPSVGPATRTPPMTVRIVGIVADARAFPPLAYANQRALYLPASVLTTDAGRAWIQSPGTADMLAVRVHGGAAAFGAFMQDVDKIAGRPIGSDTQVSIEGDAQRSMHLQALALWLTAAFGALVLVVIMGQLLLRQMAEHVSTRPALRSLGMTSGQFVTAEVLWTAVVAVGAAAAAVAVAYAASGLFPLGTARVADPDPGATFDAGVILPSVAMLAVAVVTVGAVLAARLNIQRSSAGFVPAATRSGLLLRLQHLPVVVATGIRLALKPGRGRTAVPVRSTIGAAAVGVAGVIVAMTFSASLGHLLSNPPLYGTTYDADLEMNANFGDVRSVVPALVNDPNVEAVAVANAGIPMASAHNEFGGEAISDMKGSILPTVVSGRLPDGPDEILLGVQTMAALHTGIGRTLPVEITGVTKPMPMRVVGSGILATMSDRESLGKGAVIAPSAMDRFITGVAAGFHAPPPGDLFIRFRPGLDPTPAIQALTARLGGIQKVIITAPTQPTDVANFGQVENLPQVLAGLLAALGAGTMGYLMVSAVRRRRRELAILKTLGFVPAQISAAVAWQATTVAAVALLIGVPAGIIGGRAVWTAVADQIGVVVSPQVPWLPITAVVAVAAVLANIVAAGPAAVAARISASSALRDQ